MRSLSNAELRTAVFFALRSLPYCCLILYNCCGPSVQAPTPFVNNRALEGVAETGLHGSLPGLARDFAESRVRVG